MKLKFVFKSIYSSTMLDGSKILYVYFCKHNDTNYEYLLDLVDGRVGVRYTDFEIKRVG